MLFVQPRALGTLLPRKYKGELGWIGIMAFARCTAVVVDAVRERPERSKESWDVH